MGDVDKRRARTSTKLGAAIAGGVPDAADFLRALPGLLDSDDPVSALRTRGLDLSEELIRITNNPGPRRTVASRARLELIEAAPEMGTIRFDVKPTALVWAPLPPGEFDFVIGIRFGVISSVLRALYDTRTLPRTLPIPGPLADNLLAELRLASADIPPGSDIRLGDVSLTDAPTATAVPGTENLLIHQPFSLGINRALPTPIFAEPRDIPVTQLSGILHFGMAILLDVDLNRTITLSLDAAAVEDPLTAVRIDFDPQSPVQPRSPAAISQLASALDRILMNVVVRERIKEATAGFVRMKTPGVLGYVPDFQQITFRTTATGEDGALLVGVLVEAPAGMTESPGDPSRLANPFSTDSANLYVQVQEACLNKILQFLVASGQIERRVRESRPEYSNLRVRGAHIELHPNEIRLSVQGTLKDACALGKDLKFAGHRIFRFAVFGGEITITEEDETDYDDSDAVICALGAGLEWFVPVLWFDLARQLFGFLPAISDLVENLVSSDPKLPAIVGGVFDSTVPIPGTEDLAQVEALQGLVEEDRLRGFGVITLEPDPFNTYVYATFGRTIGQPLGGHEPLGGIVVELVDQDVPRPMGDDVVVSPDEIKTVATAKLVTTVKSNYVAPTADDVIVSGITNEEGHIRFVVSPRRLLTTAGHRRETTIYRRLDSESVDVIEDLVPISETLPDVYFRLRLADGRVVDTRSAPNGLWVNLREKRLGSPEAPIRFSLTIA